MTAGQRPRPALSLQESILSPGQRKCWLLIGFQPAPAALRGERATALLDDLFRTRMRHGLLELLVDQHDFLDCLAVDSLIPTRLRRIDAVLLR